MKSNKQLPEKPLILGRGRVEVHSVFFTIQGEGIFAGSPAVFIRLAGCNLQCPQCDTEYTSERRTSTPEQVLEEVRYELKTNNLPYPPLIVITGGEPFRQEIGPLCKILLLNGFKVQVETNGTLYNEVPEEVFIVCSPKTGSLNKHLASRANAFKYVVDPEFVDEDGLPLTVLGHPCHPRVARPPKGFGGTVYVQPVDTGWQFVNKKNEQAVVALCLRHGYTLCLQLHKIIGLA